MARRYLDDEIDLGSVQDQTICVVGYGSQGRAQALNLRDSGLRVIAGNRSDSYRSQAIEDGIELFSIEEAASRADIALILVPDQVQQQVYETLVEPNLRPGATVVFAHGYSLHYALIKPRQDLDVVIVAPKMIGDAVRTCYESGAGFATLVAAHQDPSGQAFKTALAIAKGIGGARLGAWMSTVEEETVTDLFNEQAMGSAMIGALKLGFETLVDAGYDPDIVALELYASGEMVEDVAASCRHGILNALRIHSPASQYGHLSRVNRMAPASAKDNMRECLDEITNGAFAAELEEAEQGTRPGIDSYMQEHDQHPMFESESRILGVPRVSDVIASQA